MRKIFVFFLIMCWMVTAYSQSRILGLVTDAHSGNLLSGASVAIVEMNTKTLTDVDGTYSFNTLQPGQYHVIVSYVGYKT
ncbi:MAG TPA: carboxypeptidase-like regulatory domain-containing protein, partial [Bacteroidales bacterium]|nr:carboxypeptidase-like regulatory domain-containing protein [Bacteroidales bacterium]